MEGKKRGERVKERVCVAPESPPGGDRICTGVLIGKGLGGILSDFQPIGFNIR